MSPKAAVTLLIGAEPKKPAQKRVMNTEAVFLLRAVPMESMARQKTAGRMLTLRPQISETGAQLDGNPAFVLDAPTLRVQRIILIPFHQICRVQKSWALFGFRLLTD
jgi:hypothetical protein